VASMLGCQRDGFFLDLAANDASVLSNTLMMERDLGWNGICVEANVDYLYGLSHRRCEVINAAVGSPTNQEVAFTLRGVLGGVVGPNFDNQEANTSQKFRLVSLMNILERLSAPKQIDYFSLDVEGAESLIMKDFDWERYRFRIITVERPKKDLKELLEKAGYKYVRTNSDFDDETWIDGRLSVSEVLEKTWGANREGPYQMQKTLIDGSCMTKRGYGEPLGVKVAP